MPPVRELEFNWESQSTGRVRRGYGAQEKKQTQSIAGALFAQGYGSDWNLDGFHTRPTRDHYLDSYRSALSLFRHLAIGNQHRYNNRYVPDGFPDSTEPKQRCAGHPPEAERN